MVRSSFGSVFTSHCLHVFDSFDVKVNISPDKDVSARPLATPEEIKTKSGVRRPTQQSEIVVTSSSSSLCALFVYIAVY